MIHPKFIKILTLGLTQEQQQQKEQGHFVAFCVSGYVLHLFSKDCQLPPALFDK